ncbi:MAG: hypothetical protein AAFY35_16890 [Pseudomonadota bacterium]
MKLSALEDLAQLSRARQDADAAKLQTIRAEEAKIRAQLAALDAHHRAGMALPVDEKLSQQRLGADMLWQVWVGRRRRELQIQLARCLAQKGAARRALQKSFGKRSALQTVQVELENRALRDRKLKAFDAVTQLGVYQRQRRV